MRCRAAGVTVEVLALDDASATLVDVHGKQQADSILLGH